MPEIPEEGQEKALVEDAPESATIDYPCQADMGFCNCACCDGCSTDPQVSGIPVNAADGSLGDLAMGGGFHSNGYGYPMRDSLVHTNRAIPNQYDRGRGVGLLNEGEPSLFLVEGLLADSMVINIGRERHWYDEGMSDWTGRHGTKNSFEHDSSNDVFTFTKSDGSQYVFHDLDQTSNPKGTMKEYIAPNGVKSTYTYSGDFLDKVERSVTIDSTTTTESFVYDRFTSGTHVDRVEYVTMQRKVGGANAVNVMRLCFTYFGTSESYGPKNALKTVELQYYNGSGWDSVGTTYYRYYKSGQSDGYEYALKYALSPEAYKRLDDAVADPLTATDAQVDDYADYYFEYDSEDRVKTVKTHAGSCTWTLTYSESTHTDDYNNWKFKTTVTKPDSSQLIYYANYIGQVLLIEHKDGSDSWIDHWKYDSTSSQVLEHRHPSSISSYSDTSADLNVSLNSSAGRIDVITYYSTTSGSGVKDYKEYDKVKKGSSGTEIKLKKYEYTSRTANSITIYPISKETVYRNDDGTGAIETSYSYSWHSSSLQIEERVTTLPAIPTSQNGSGTANTRTERFDAYANPIWLKDERGFITRRKYDVPKGVMTQLIQDVDTTSISDEPSGWVTPTGGGLHLTSDFEYDDFGRQTQSLGPAHEIDISGTATSIRRASWTVYDDVDNEVRTASGYGSGSGHSTYTLINPVSISIQDLAGRAIEQIQATRASTSGKLASSDTFARSSYVRWSTMSYDDEGHMEWSRLYHDIPSSGDGSSGTNYNQTDVSFSCGGERTMSKTPGGTITRTVFDVRGNAEQVYFGTDDTGATESDPTNGGAGGNNMKLVTENEFDSGNDGGDNHLTKVIQHVDASTTRVTSYIYDFRGQQTDIDGEIDFYQISTYDNLGQVTRIDRKDTTSTGTLIGRSESSYDDLGRVYQSKRYAVDPATGTVGNALTDKTWYDGSGNVIKQHPAGSEAFTKTQYDGLGRAEKNFVGYDTDETAYADADDVVGDTIFEQNETEYDEASNVIRTILRRRFHDATGTGELTSPSGSQPKARVSYVAMYPDALGRQQAIANYGTNGGSAHTRCDDIPQRSDNVLVAETFYNDDGEAWKSIDPADKEDQIEFDDAGRRTKTMENYDDGNPTTGTADKDRTVVYTYNADGQVTTITVKQQSSSDDQVTTYVYGTTLSDSDIARADLLRSEIYPDSDDVPSPLGDGADTTYDRIEYKYNRLGQRTEMKDQNGTVHAYDYDKLGRQSHDRVTTVGSSIDNAILRLTRSYEVRGLLEKVTSYDNATIGSGNVVNELQQVFNDFGLLEIEYQEHSGATNISDSPRVQYAYTNGTNNHVRLTTMTYPNGRILRYEYSSGDDDELSRLSFLADDDNGSIGTHLAEYLYLGLANIVEVDYTEPDLRMDLTHGSGDDPHDGPMDRFDRITDLLWSDYGASSDAARIKHGYDRVGNRLWREDPVAASNSKDFDELYSYDGLNQLTSMQRGNLNGTKDDLVSMTMNRGQQWSLDPIGNWSNFKEDSDGDGAWDLDQNRTHNKANEITAIASSSSHIGYDNAGNTTKMPKPGNWSSHFDITYDAWNRIVLVDDGATSHAITAYEYDGLHRRVSEGVYDSNVLQHTVHLFYSPRWRLLEERIDNANLAQRQYVWGIRYVDDLILRDRNADDDSETGALGIVDSGLEERIYGLGDGNANMIAICDTEGDIIERFVFDAYGNPSFYDDVYDSVAASSVDWNLLFATTKMDDASGLRHVRYRDAIVTLGRWAQRDPIKYGDGFNLFRVLANSPLNRVDPSGLKLYSDGLLLGRLRQLCPEGKFTYQLEFHRIDFPFSWQRFWGLDWGSREPEGAYYRIKSRTDGFCEARGKWGQPCGCELSDHPTSCCCICKAINSRHTIVLVEKSDKEDGGGKTTGPWKPRSPKDEKRRSAEIWVWIYVQTTRTEISVPGTGDSDPPGGDPQQIRAPDFLVLGHELCGHAISDDSRRQHTPAGKPGDPGYFEPYSADDPAIIIENEIRREHSTDDNDYGKRGLPGIDF